jgi:hypothetical protein
VTTTENKPNPWAKKEEDKSVIASKPIESISKPVEPVNEGPKKLVTPSVFGA